VPIYEFYCPDNHRIYQFYARTLAQGRLTPKCPDDPRFRMQKVLSAFAVVGRAQDRGAGGGGVPEGPGAGPDEGRMEAAMGEMEREFSSVDENDPRAMGRMMRRMADLTGQKMDGQMEEVVRKLEEGADPDSLEEQFGDSDGPGDESPGAGGGELPPGAPKREGRHRFRARRGPPLRDPKLYDYE